MSRIFVRFSAFLIVINLTMTLALPGLMINKTDGDENDQMYQNSTMNGVNTTEAQQNVTGVPRLTFPMPGNVKPQSNKPCGSSGPCPVDHQCENKCRRRCVDENGKLVKGKGKKSCGGLHGNCPEGQSCKKKCGDICVKPIDCINRPCGDGLPPCCNYRECAYGFNKTFHPVQYCWYNPAGA